jgi:hypothetical protein
MRTVRKIVGILLMLLPLLSIAEVKEIPFTLDDRDRIIRTEQKLEAVDKKLDLKVDGLRSEMNARFDQLFNFLWAIIGIFTTMMVSVFGFAFWDRKLSLAPIKRENARTLEALREYAEHQPKLREILKNAGLL